MMTRHLTDEQIFAVVMGESDGAAHLQECADCRAQVSGMQASISAFRESADDWVASMPVMSPVTRPAYRPRPLVLTMAGSAVAALAMVVAYGLHAGHKAEAPEVGVAAVQEESARQIGADNELLRNVDLALSEPPRLAVSVAEPAAKSARAGTLRRD